VSYKTAFVNAFASGLFDGNTAAVVLLDSYPSALEMLGIAKLYGFSETAFIQREGEAKYHIRWFTPEVEVSLCGHATLASAAFLFSEMEQAAKLIHFSSLSGKLVAKRKGDEIELDFPSDIPETFLPEDQVLQALGISHAIDTLYAPATRNLVVVLDSADEVTGLQPNFECLRGMQNLPYFGIAVTAATPEGYICRYFAPWEGINEDPVTGSAQTFLAPYWANKLGITELKGYQASARGGHFNISIFGERVLIRGNAVIYLTGALIRG
jgi:PhzF family phenazine biosynthesis protein